MKVDNKSQKNKFIKTAREHGCEDNSERYDALVKKVGEQKPTPRKPEGKK